jgi:hypothetical protein
MIKLIIWPAYTVISKIEHFFSLAKHPGEGLKLTKFESPEALVKIALIQARYSKATNVTYGSDLGTLGYCYKVEIGNERRFLKIYSGDKSNPSKETVLMSHLSDGEFAITSGQFEYGTACYSWYLLPFFESIKSTLKIIEVQDLIHSYGSKLLNCNSLDLCRDKLSFKVLTDYAAIALERLGDPGLISKDTYLELKDRISVVLSEHKTLEPKICHGDLSPKNIMQNKDRLIAIDWEDAFWGFEGYDFLYWLTFMQNKHHIDKSLFGRGQMNVYFETSVMSLIILLKSWLSLMDGSVRNHRIGFNERLNEVMILG